MPRTKGLSPQQAAPPEAALKLPPELDLKVEMMATSAIQPDPTTPWKHPEKQYVKLISLIRDFGFVIPLVINHECKVIAGHARLEAAKRLGLKSVPVIVLDHLSEAQQKALALADNKLGQLAKVDPRKLGEMFASILNVDVDFNIEATGFSSVEIDFSLDLAAKPLPEKEEQVAEAEGPAVTRLGDMWKIADQVLICGDARDGEVYDRLLGGELARMAFTDPPYNCKIQGFVGGKGKTRRREFVMGSGELTPEQFDLLLRDAFGQMVSHSVDGAIHYVCIDWRGYPLLHEAAMAHYSRQMNLCVWKKNNAGLGSFYRSQHELVPVYKVGEAAHINTFGLGETGRWRSNIWEYRGKSSFGPGRDEELAMHSTVKNLTMVCDAIRDVSRRGDIVLDPFLGSGTTLKAAAKTGRRGRGVELDPLYADTVCKRLQDFTGEPAILVATGQTFDEVAAERLEEASHD